MRTLLIILTLFVSTLIRAQSPAGIPNTKTNGYIEHKFVQADSGFIAPNADTTVYIARFPFTIMGRRIGTDTTLYFYTGQRWKPIGSGSAAIGSLCSGAPLSIAGITTYNAYGDSYTDGNFSQNPAQAYPIQLASNLSLTLTNNGLDAAGIYSVARTVLLKNYVSATRADLATVLVGLIDVISNKSIDLNKNKVAGLSRVIASNLFMQTATPFSDGSVTKTGFFNSAVACQSKSTVLGGNVIASKTIGQNVAFSFTGDNLIIGTFATTPGKTLGAFNIVIDGVNGFGSTYWRSYTGSEYYCNTGSYTNANESGLNIYPDAVVIRGLTNAAHTAVLTMATADSVFLDYFGVMDLTTNVKPVVWGSIPRQDENVYLNFSTIYNPNINFDIDGINRTIRTAMIDFYGYPLSYVDVNNYWFPYTMVQRPDNLHPKTIGMTALFNAFKNGINNQCIESVVPGPYFLDSTQFIRNQYSSVQTPGRFNINDSAKIGSLVISKQGLGSAPSLRTNSFLTILNDLNIVALQSPNNDNPELRFTGPSSAVSIPFTGVINGFNFRAGASEREPFLITTSGFNTPVSGIAGNLLLKPGTNFGSAGSDTAQYTNDSIFLQPAGQGVAYFTKDIVALDSVRLPNIISKTDTTNFKPVSIDASGNLFKMTTWPGSGGGGGGGTVTNFVFTNGGGFTGGVTNPTTTPTLGLTLQDAAADGTTKGQSTYTAADFNASSGLISIDYTNGQAASASLKGFLTSADWTTFNAKIGASDTATITSRAWRTNGNNAGGSTWSLGTTSNDNINLITNNTIKGFISAGGTFVWGSSSATAGFKVDLRGRTQIFTSPTGQNELLIDDDGVNGQLATVVINPSGTNSKGLLLTGLNDNIITGRVYGSSTDGFAIGGRNGSATVGYFGINNSVAITATSGTFYTATATNSFAPTSGTAEHNVFEDARTINQTGGANGATRGLYIHPTLTAAASYTAIQNTVGNNSFNSASGNSNFGGTLSYSVTTSSAGTLTLGTGIVYVFTNTTATWTLPAVSGTTGRVYFLKNRGSGNVTLGTNAAANELYDTAATNTLTILPGQSIMLISDGTYFLVN